MNNGKLGTWALGICVVVMIELLLLLAVSSYIERETTAQGIQRAKTNHINALEHCVSNNQMVEVTNLRALEIRKLRTVFSEFLESSVRFRREQDENEAAAEAVLLIRRLDQLNFRFNKPVDCLAVTDRPPGVKESDVPKYLLEEAREYQVR